ncbi:efflux RND transporter periplasmic adaptor subunit [Pseudoalteromonas sp. JBTF-M23]|uniref:Efflux RND transporter periplasmic adaptor subunit n=1 Tax=Pseudoalteromonas caenipelagi TaxID=2726988 RepID=A0A849VDP1_9GAMM|nr:efflux RND transporter periplasmic adaptor subunit [Pseudoalteromonas caenipelagi]NOU51225.1 efflux RND transporter periplasmic adaptor subunit [Pseudoalteromonas caenipelagi]
MQTKTLKWILPLAVLMVGVVGAVGINAIAADPQAKEPIDSRPVVEVESISALDHQVMINSYGEVKPFEQTQLSVQVSGEVTYWHPSFIAGGIVARGDVLMRIEKDNYEAALLQAQAELSRAKAALIEEQALADVAEDEARRFPSKKHTDLFLRKPQLMSARASVKSAEAALKRAQRDLDNCEVVAPYDALVVSRNIGLGQFVGVGTSVAQLNNIESAEVIIPIAGFDSAFLPKIVAGTKANVTQSGLNGFTREAVIDRDLGVVDTQTRMVNLVVRIDDPYGLKSDQPAVKFGAFVQVNFAGKTLNRIYRLPQDLVNNQTVWLLNDDNKLEPRKVQVIREEGEFFFVNVGLNDNERIVTTVPEYPQKGMAVKVAGADSSDAQPSSQKL